MNTQQKTRGFTIIEVVLVLAIAGLIFLMVFIALPALQRSTRDTQRKSDLSRVITALNNYTTNYRGALPADLAAYNGTFKSGFLITSSNDSFIDPAGSNSTPPATETSYIFVLSGSGTTSALTTPFGSDTTQNRIYVTPNSTCGASGDTVTAGSRSVSFRMILEGGGVACVSK